MTRVTGSCSLKLGHVPHIWVMFLNRSAHLPNVPVLRSLAFRKSHIILHPTFYEVAKKCFQSTSMEVSHHEEPPVCCWNTSIESPSSIPSCEIEARSQVLQLDHFRSCQHFYPPLRKSKLHVPFLFYELSMLTYLCILV